MMGYASAAAGRHGGRRQIVLVLALVVAGLSMAFAAQPARAAFDLVSFSNATLQMDGSADAQAGSHPYAEIVSFEVPQTIHPQFGGPVAAGYVKDLTVDLPAGFVGNPTAAGTCSTAELSFSTPRCPVDSQVGVVNVTFATGVGPATDYQKALFNMEPGFGQVARFGFNSGIAGAPVEMFASLRSDSDYGVRVTLKNIAQASSILRASVEFWGVPRDSHHDARRGPGFTCIGDPSDLANCKNGGETSGLAPEAFLTNPTACGGPLTTTLDATTWEGDADTASSTTASGITGCERLPFAPSISVKPDSAQAGAPSGLTVDLAVPQTTNVAGLATAALRDARVTLPVGVGLNAPAADGLGSCTDAQIGLHSTAPVACPDASKIGDLTIDTPLLHEQLSGSIYLGQPVAGKRYRIFLDAESAARGVSIRVEGVLRTDPVTGQITSTFDDNPQLPFSLLHLHFKGGARAPLAMPRACGTYTTEAALTSWASATPVSSRSSFTLDQNCGQQGRFEPSLASGTVNPAAGVSSPLVLRFSRPDGQRELGAVNGSFPPGLLGVLKSVPLCSAARGAAGTCPAASRVGRVQVAVGAGSQPLWLPVAGQPENAVYLTEPYRNGDVAGMSIVVPAVAGPYDLGTVVTKVYLKLRDGDQGIDFQSDRLPRILEGLPLNIREIAMTIDRKGFMVNPTNCDPMATYANVFSQSWAKVPVTNRFQVGGCATLRFSPIIGATAGGKGDVKRYQHPALKVTVRQPAEQAHLSKANVVLPKELNIDLKAPALKAACPREDYAEDKCSPVATVGSVRAVTPLLREPLEGPAFLIQKKGQLPDIVMRLRNDRMSLDLIGVLDFLKDGRLITRVKGIPDAALSSFVLTIKGGKGGSLLNRSDLCAKRRLVKATFKGQNGKLSRKTPLLHIAGCATAHAKARATASAEARRASAGAVRRASASASAARGVRARVAQSRAVGGRS